MINVRLDTSELRSDRIKLLTDWIRSLGLDPADFGTWMLVRANKDFVYELHLSKRRRAEGGGIVLDRASNEPVSEPLIFPLTTEQLRAMPKIGIEAVEA
jgi:hypothetical protein